MLARSRSTWKALITTLFLRNSYVARAMLLHMWRSMDSSAAIRLLSNSELRRTSMNKKLAAGLAALSIVGGSFGVAAVGPFGVANAQSTTTAPSATSAAATSNEDPTHEATETAAQEAAEDAGIGRGHHGSNEDPGHEATESPERESAEDAAQAGGSTTLSATSAS